MNTPNQSLRGYKISDDTMLQDTRTIIKEFDTDKTSFTMLDDDFKDPFRANWQAAIATVDNAPTDEQIVDSQTSLTQNVETTMEACRQQFQAAKYFIEKAFPDKPAVWNEFGYDNYIAARKSPEKMAVFMQVFNKVATKYKTELIAKKYTQAQIDDILTKRQALLDARTNQELAKNARGGFTQNRVDALNKVWGFRLAVARAAKQIFANNYARYNVYLLPASEESDTVFNIKGTVTDAATKKPIENVSINWNSESATSDSNGKYGIAQLSKGSITITYSASGYTNLTKTVDYKGELLVLDVVLDK